MKFALMVEGYTERKAIAPFLKRWIDPQIQERISISTFRFNGCVDLLHNIAKRTRTILNNPRHGREIIAVISLLDFYGPTFPFPKGIDSTNERCQWATKYIEGLVSDDRFRHFFAVHEFEAWLLSMPTLFPDNVRRHLPKQAPESVNTNVPPKKVLRELYRLHTGNEYIETVNGPDLFSRLNPADAYAKCPNLKALLDEMLLLAHGAGL